MTIYLSVCRPLETSFANKMEIMNEATTIALTYCLMCFTQFVADPETRNLVGFAYLGINMLNVLIHLLFLILATCSTCKLSCKRCLAQRRASEHADPKESIEDESSSSYEEDEDGEDDLEVVEEVDSGEESDRTARDGHGAKKQNKPIE